MYDHHGSLPGDKVVGIVGRLLAERSVNRAVAAEEDLRAAGLTSLDMVNLVLTIEAEINVNIPEEEITPANFRSIAAISNLVNALLNP